MTGRNHKSKWQADVERWQEEVEKTFLLYEDHIRELYSFIGKLIQIKENKK